MTTFAYFNAYGDCVHIIDSIEPPEGGVEVEENTDPNQIWYDHANDEIIHRQPIPVTFRGTYLVGESIDFSVPDGSVALLDGVKTTGAVVFDHAQDLLLQVVGRHHHDQRIRIVSFADMRDERWAEARRYREQCTNGGCATAWGRVDTDSDSQIKVSGAVQMAMLAQMAGDPYSIDWTMADNSQVTLDAAGMMQMGVTVGEHVKACHAAGTNIRAAIEAAADEAALAAIDITAGYP